MTPQELKNSILQLAIQGKLVEQRPEEGTTEELYRQIQQEKQRLIKEGKIKKEKPLPEIAEEEKPFDIPESWMWVRLGDCTSYSQTKEKVSPDSIKHSLWSLDLEDIEKDSGKIIRIVFASDRKIVGDKVRFHCGQILYSKLRPYLKKILVAPDDGICTPELVPFSAYGGIDAHYLISVLKAPHVDYVINSVTYGVKMPRVGTETMVNLLIPLPPLSEQKRIVAKIEEFLPLIDRYEKAWSRLEEFNERFPDDMQKSILQMAIQGKLVEQRPEEGTGEELYRQIQAEKQKLIKEGKIKKDKPLPEITEEEKPFDIPDSWKWVRIGSIVNGLFAGGDKPVDFSELPDEIHKYPVVANGIKNDGILGYTATPTAKANTITVAGRGTIGFSLYREYEYCPIVRLIVIEHNKAVCPQYLQRTLQALPEKSLGTSIPQLTVPMLYPKLIPLPPLAEQYRIVTKLEELLPICERLKK